MCHTLIHVTLPTVQGDDVWKIVDKGDWPSTPSVKNVNFSGLAFETVYHVRVELEPQEGQEEKHCVPELQVTTICQEPSTFKARSLSIGITKRREIRISCN